MTSSEDNKDGQLAVKEEKITDFAEHEIKLLERFKEDGLVGISQITPEQITSAFSMYMQGMSYTEISQKLNVKKKMILYYSERANWIEQKRDKLVAISGNISTKLAQAKLESLNTAADTFQALKQYYASKFEEYIKTNDPSVLDKMNTRLLPHLFKAMEVIGKLDEKDKPNAPTFNINIHSDKATISSDGKSVDISTLTAEEEIVSSFRKLAQEKRQAMVDKRNAEIAKAVILKKKEE